MNKLTLAAVAGLRNVSLEPSRVEKFHHAAEMSGVVTQEEAEEIWQSHPYPESVLRLIIRKRMEKLCTKTSSIK